MSSTSLGISAPSNMGGATKRDSAWEGTADTAAWEQSQDKARRRSMSDMMQPRESVVRVDRAVELQMLRLRSRVVSELRELERQVTCTRERLLDAIDAKLLMQVSNVDLQSEAGRDDEGGNADTDLEIFVMHNKSGGSSFAASAVTQASCQPEMRSPVASPTANTVSPGGAAVTARLEEAAQDAVSWALPRTPSFKPKMTRRLSHVQRAESILAQVQQESHSLNPPTIQGSRKRLKSCLKNPTSLPGLVESNTPKAHRPSGTPSAASGLSVGGVMASGTYNPAMLFDGDPDLYAKLGTSSKREFRGLSLWRRVARLLGVESDDERDEDAERVKPKDLEAEVDAETQVEAEAEKLKRSNQLSSGVEKILDYLSNASKRRGSRIKQILNNRKRTLANRRLIEQRVQARLDARNSVLLVDHYFYKIWTMILLVVLSYCILAVPFFITFQWDKDMHPSIFVLEILVATVLSFDVVIHFNLGFYKPNGVLVCEREDILKHYISSWFVFDVLAAIPWSLLSLSFLRMDPFFSRFQLLSILRIPKIVHMDQLLNFQLHFEGVETVRMVKVVMGILLMCHYNGCFWYFVGDKTDPGWIQAQLEKGVNLDTTWDKYAVSLYFSVVSLTTVGFGDVTAVNNFERLYAILALLLGSAIFSFLVAATSNYVSQTDSIQLQKQQQLHELNAIFMHHNFEDDLRGRIRMYSEYQIERMVSGEQNNLLSRLPFSLRKEVMMKIHGSTLENAKVFKNCDTAVVQRLAVEFESACYLPNQKVCNAGDLSWQLVVLNKGFVEEYTVLTSDFIQTCLDHNLLSAESDDLLAETPLQTISILSSGHIWGGIALVNERELLNRRSVTFVEAAELPIARLETLLKSFPQMAADLKLHAAVSHKKSAVVVSKLEDLSDSEEDIEFATSFLRARKKITKLLSMVKHAYESKTFTEDEIREFLTVKREDGKRATPFKLLRQMLEEQKNKLQRRLSASGQPIAPGVPG